MSYPNNPAFYDYGGQGAFSNGMYGQSDFHPPPPAHDPSPLPRGEDPLATACLGVGTLINNVIAHPCTVLRRQCQVHQLARRQHLVPFTLVPVVAQIIAKDGVWTLWKGSIGTGVLWGLSRVSEILIADIFNLPRNVVPNGSSEKFWRYVYMKASSLLATSPFIIASFIETVRSTTGFSLDDVKVFDVIVRGVDRVRMDFFGAKDSSRRFSVLYLSLPTAAYYTGHFLVTNWLYNVIYNMARRYVGRKPMSERTRFHTIMPEMFATITSSALADFICFPAETVLHRLYIQGTRTLIDNLDSGASAISVTAKYTGIIDCVRTILNREGFSALYSGVGALTLQYGLQFLVLQTIRSIFNQVGSGTTDYVDNNTATSQSYNSATMGLAQAATAPHYGSERGSRDALDAIRPFPNFAQTAQSADISWSGYLTPPRSGNHQFNTDIISPSVIPSTSRTSPM